MNYRDILFYFLALGGWLIVCITMIWALFHDFWYAFHINMYGEAWLDILIVIFAFGYSIYYIIYKMREL